MAAKPLGDREALETRAETAAFLLSLIDQSALNILGAENRILFMDALEANVVHAIEVTGVEPKVFWKLLRIRYDQYSKHYPWFRDGRTSFREFVNAVGPTLDVCENIAFDAALENMVLSSLRRYELLEILRLP